MIRALGRVVRGLLAVAGGLAFFLGAFGLIGIVAAGIGATLREFDQHGSEGSWTGLLVIGCAIYAFVWIVRAVIKARAESKRQCAELYAAAVRLGEAALVLLRA